MEGLLIAAFIGEIIKRNIGRGMPQTYDTGIALITGMFISIVLVIGIWTSIINLGFVSIRDLEKEEKEKPV